MSFGTSSLFLKINLVLLIVTVILDLLGLALPYWVAIEGTNVNYGLWQLCPGESLNSCQSINNAPDWLEASQAFAIIGFLVLIVALVLTIVVIFLKDMKVLKLIAWILCFVAALCILIEFAVFCDNTSSGNYSGAFALTIIAFVLAIVCGIIGVIDWLGKGK